jgi:hypothetical protein
MGTDDKTEVPKGPTRVVSSSPGNAEWGSEVSSDSAVNLEWTTVLGGLPDLTPEEAVNFYNRALASLTATRVRGFYGATDGSDERADDVTLLLYRDDPKSPVLRLVMSRPDILRFVEALNDLVARFRQ